MLIKIKQGKLYKALLSAALCVIVTGFSLSSALTVRAEAEGIYMSYYSQGAWRNFTDGAVDIRDIVRIKRLCVEAQYLKYADINSDGIVNAEDLSLLTDFIVNNDRRYITEERYTYDEFSRVISFTSVSGKTVHYTYE